MTPAHQRVVAVDVVRGLAMVVMVLDHTRDFAHAESFLFDPTDPEQTTPAIFLTRWITHFVAPIFVLLAGVSARLQVDHGRSRREIARFLVLRGLLLVLLEFTVVRVGIWFNVDPTFLGMLQVIWVLGISMVMLAGLVFLPDLAIAGAGVALIVGHNLFDDVTPAPGLEALWSILHMPDNLAIVSAGQPDLLVLYPLVPWVGVIAVGYALGRLYELGAVPRRRLLIGVGLATTVGWLVIRTANGYGDPAPWRPFADPVRTVMSFLAAEKYPPSLAFLAMTLGPTLVLLGLLDGAAGDTGTGTRHGGGAAGRILSPLGRGLATLGAVPLFFYLLQWYVAHGLSLAAEVIAGQDVAWHFLAPPERFFSIPPDAGFPLPMVYLLWLTGIAILYPVCRRYAAARRTRGGILRYL